MTPEQIRKIIGPAAIPATLDDLTALITHTWNNARNEALEEAALKIGTAPNGYAEQFAGIVRALKHKDGQP